MARWYDVDITMEGSRGRVVIDGNDISKGVRGFSVRGGVGEVTSLELDLNLIDVTRVSSTSTEILISDGASEALIAMGWKPPDLEGSEKDREENQDLSDEKSI